MWPSVRLAIAGCQYISSAHVRATVTYHRIAFRVALQTRIEIRNALKNGTGPVEQARILRVSTAADFADDGRQL